MSGGGSKQNAMLQMMQMQAMQNQQKQAEETMAKSIDAMTAATSASAAAVSNSAVSNALTKGDTGAVVQVGSVDGSASDSETGISLGSGTKKSGAKRSTTIGISKYW